MSSWSSSSDNITLLHTLGIPMVIVAVASAHVAPQLMHLLDVFLHSLTTTEQVAMLAIVFALVFAAVGTSHVPLLSSSSSGHDAVSAPTGSRSKGDVATSSTTASSPSSSSSSSITYPLQQLDALSSDMDKFVALFPMLREEILDHLQANEMPSEALDWCKSMMDYNVPGGKLNRGTTVLTVYRALLLHQNQNPALSSWHIARAAVLGWTIEFLQAFFLVADDVMDDSHTRRGQPCWYKLPHVQLIAINDSFLLESFVFSLLRRHFGHEPFYLDLVELLLDVIQKTEFGQLLDLTSQPKTTEEKNNQGNMLVAVVDLERFTLDRYQRIVKYKTAFYSFYLPVAMGLILSGTRDQATDQLARRICCTMGEYFQIQDDFLDCFGDPQTIGKVGTDIQDNKCSWLVVQALQRCTPSQRKLLQENYGQWDDQKVATVKKLYRELELPKVFEEYEETSYRHIQAQLDDVTTVPREVFDVLLQKIYKRSK